MNLTFTERAVLTRTHRSRVEVLGVDKEGLLFRAEDGSQVAIHNDDFIPEAPKEVKVGEMLDICYVHARYRNSSLGSAPLPEDQFLTVEEVEFFPDTQESALELEPGTRAGNVIFKPLNVASSFHEATSALDAARVVRHLFFKESLDVAFVAALQVVTGLVPREIYRNPPRMKDVVWDGYPHESEMFLVFQPPQGPRRLVHVVGIYKQVIETAWRLLGGFHARPEGLMVLPAKNRYLKVMRGFNGQTPWQAAGLPFSREVNTLSFRARDVMSELDCVEQDVREPLAADVLEGLGGDWKDDFGVAYIHEGKRWFPLYYTQSGWVPGHSRMSPWKNFGAVGGACLPATVLRLYERGFRNLCWGMP